MAILKLMNSSVFYLKLILTLIFYISVFSFCCFAQSITWQRVLNNNYGALYKVQQTYDGGYVAVGTDVVSGLPTIYLTKLDYLGNTLWTKIFGVGYTKANWVEETSDRGFIIGGSTDSGMSADKAYIIKTDSAGNLLWHKTYSISGMDQCYCVKQTSDKGYILSCRYFPDVVGTWFIKTDSLGNIIWQKIYYHSNFYIGVFEAIEILSNGFISVGGIEAIGSSNADVFVIRLNAYGDSLWSKRYGGSNTQEVGNSINRIDNTGFIISGYSVSYNPDSTSAYLLRTDTSGNYIWQTSYNTGLDERCYSVIYKQNIGFVMAGAADTNVINWFNARIRIVDTAGNVLNVKSFFPDTRGGWFSDISQTADGGYILCGASNGATTVRMYAVKTDSLLYANAIGIIKISNHIPDNFVLYQNYPNPFNPKTSIKYEIPKDGQVTLKIYDITGREIASITEFKQAGSYTYTFDGTNYASGLYLYRLEARQAGSSTGGYVETKKMLLIK